MTREPLSTSSSDPAGGLRGGIRVTEPARRAARPHGWPVAMAAAAALVICFEVGFVYKFRYRILDSTYSLAEIKQGVVTSDAPADDVAIFGNSRFYHLDPERLKEFYGADARITNYAWAWCGVEIYEAMLRALIENDRKPEIVLVDGNPEFFGYRPELLSVAGEASNQSRYEYTAPLWPALRVQVAQGLWGPAWQTLSSYMTPPSMLYGERVAKGVERFIDDRKLPKPRKNFDQIVGHWLREGWIQYGPEAVATMDDFKAMERDNGPFVLYENTHVLRAYERFLSLAQRHGVRVIMLPVPHNPLIYSEYEKNGVFAAYDAWLNEMQAKYPVFRAPAPRWQDWPGMLGDAGHLNAAGIRRHMDLVMEMLQQLKAGLI